MQYDISYVCRHVNKKIEHNHELKEELTLCLVFLLKGSDSKDYGADEELMECLLALTGLEPQVLM